MEISKERVLIVGVELDRDEITIEDSMDELRELVEAAGGEVVASVIQRKERLNPAFFIGKGKATEIRENSELLDVDTVVFNDELSGAQLRNLEELIQRKIVDRTNLILDIFALRAVSKEGKLQVRLAQLKYRLPRLVGFRDYLSREGAGIGTRGPGEQKLETDRRHILREINSLERQLKEIEEVREVKRKRRVSSQLPMVALVGYTNAGKSTLLNALMDKDHAESDKSVFVEDMLFATLDTSHRISRLPNGQEYLLADTVGFVSKLPTKLVEAFKGTLEEVKYADLLLHVVDVSSDSLDIQIQTTLKLIKELEAADKPVLTVFNKIDKLDGSPAHPDMRGISEHIDISARYGTNLDELQIKIQHMLPQVFREVEMKIPYSEQAVLSAIMDKYDTKILEYEEDGTVVSLVADSIDYEKYKKFIRD
ncbi:MAG: GTPase HflX [Gudongella sp.]|nr:GTPase HflX [Gudongella sp.]